MNEFYIEQLVKRNSSKGKMVLSAFLMALGIICLAGGVLVNMVLLSGAVISLVLYYFIAQGNSLEFEYLYINGQLDIDKIISMKKRKHAYSMDMNDLVVIAPLGSDQLMGYQDIKLIDFSSKNGKNTVYKAVVVKNGEKVGVLLEPNEKILNAMKLIAPRKVL